MDVFFCTGERSGDAMVADMAREIRRRLGPDVAMEGLVGPLSAEAGVTNMQDTSHLALVGVDAGKLRAWARRVKAVAELLQRRRPKVFVGVSHCTFNVALGERLPADTHRMFVAPPEIWAWQVGRWGRLVERAMALAAWFDDDPYSVLGAATVAAGRTIVPLKHYDELLCLTPMNYQAYAARGRRYRWPAKVRHVGHPMATLRRTDRLAQDAAALREGLGIDPETHVLAVFPGSRKGTVDLLLPTMLRALVRILNARPDVCAVISLADPAFEAPVRDRIAKTVEQLDRNGQLLASAHDASTLLAMASHAMLTSGTITLQAACLGTPGTVAYTARRHALLGAMIDRGRCHGRTVPLALPNVIRLWQGTSRREDWPYEELTRNRFRSEILAESVAAKIPTAPYRADAPPLLAAEHEQAIRQAVQAGVDESPPVRQAPGPAVAAAESIVRQLGGRR